MYETDKYFEPKKGHGFLIQKKGKYRGIYVVLNLLQENLFTFIQMMNVQNTLLKEIKEIINRN